MARKKRAERRNREVERLSTRKVRSVIRRVRAIADKHKRKFRPRDGEVCIKLLTLEDVVYGLDGEPLNLSHPDQMAVRIILMALCEPDGGVTLIKETIPRWVVYGNQYRPLTYQTKFRPDGTAKPWRIEYHRDVGKVLMPVVARPITVGEVKEHLRLLETEL